MSKKFIIPIILVLLSAIGIMGFMIVNGTVSDQYDTTNLLENEQTLNEEEMDELARKTLIVFAKNFDTSDTGAINVKQSNNIYTLTYDKTKDAEKAYKRYSKDKNVIYCELDATIETTDTEEILDTGDSYNEVMDNVNINGNSELIVESHLNTSTTAKVYENIDMKEVDTEAKTKVVVIDSGATGTYKNTYNAVNGSKDVTDVNGHGTKMISIIEKELEGCNYEIIPIKVTNDNGLGTISSLVNALDYASTLEPTVVNMSLAAYDKGNNALVSEYITKMTHQGTIVVASAGNDSDNVMNYIPANISEAVVVGASDVEGKIQGFSNWGETIDYLAEGNSTSEAAAYMSGIFAEIHAKGLDVVDVIDGSAYITKYEYDGAKLGDERSDLTLVDEKTCKSLVKDFQKLVKKDDVNIKEVITLLINSEVNAFEIISMVDEELFTEFCNKLSDEDLYAFQYALRCEFLEIMSDIKTVGTEADIERYKEYLRIYERNEFPRLVDDELYAKMCEEKTLTNLTVFEDEQKVRNEVEALFIGFTSEKEKIKAGKYIDYLESKSIIPISVFDMHLVQLDNVTTEEASGDTIYYFGEVMKKNFGLGSPDDIVRLMGETIKVKNTGYIYGYTWNDGKGGHPSYNCHSTFDVIKTTVDGMETSDMDRAFCGQHWLNPPAWSGQTATVTAVRYGIDAGAEGKMRKTLYYGYLGPGKTHEVFTKDAYLDLYKKEAKSQTGKKLSDTAAKKWLGCTVTAMTCHYFYDGKYVDGKAVDTNVSKYDYYSPCGQKTYREWIKDEAKPVYGYSVWKLSSNGLQDLFTLFPNPYTIVYDKNGGEEVVDVPDTDAVYDHSTQLRYNSLKNDKGKTVTRLTKKGHEFAGWNTKPDGSGKQYSGGATITDNLGSTYNEKVTLYAQWKPKTIKVIYRTNGGSIKSDSKYTTGNQLGKSYEDYGIYNEETKKRAYTLFAYTDKSVNLAQPVGTFSVYKNYEHLTADNAWVTLDGKYVIPSTETNNSSIIKMLLAAINNDKEYVEVVCNWEGNELDVKYNANGGSVGNKSYYKATSGNYTGGIFKSSDKSRVTTNYKYAAKSINLVNDEEFKLEKTGYSIPKGSEWIDKNGNTYTEESTTGLKHYHSLIKDDNNELYVNANWKANQYTVEYKLEKGTGSTTPYIDGKTTKANTTETYDQSFNVSNPEREGYKFIGWNISGMDNVEHYYGWDSTNKTWKDSGTTKTKTGVIYQVYKNLRGTSGMVTFKADDNSWKANQYTIKYKANGGTGTMADTKATFDQNVKLSKNTFTNPGGKHIGWAKTKQDADNEKVDFKPEATVKNLTSENNGVVTLYAVWESSKYTIQYKANGGTGTMANTSAKYGKDVQLSANKFVKTGYKHIGWATTEEAADNGTVKYNPEATVKNLSTEDGAIVPLYSVWKPNVYTINYDLNDKTGTTKAKDGENVPTSATYNQAITISNPEREGYTFEGWNISGMDGVEHYYGWDSTNSKWKETTTSTVANDIAYTRFKNLTSIDGDKIKFVADWKPITYHVTFDLNKGSGSTTPMIDGTQSKKPITATFDVEFKVNAPTRVGYTFEGWNISGMDNTIHYYGGSKTTEVTINETQKAYFKNLRCTNGNVKFIAQWKANNYAIQYDLNKGDGSTTPKHEGNKPKKGTFDTIIKVDNPTRVGYTFVGWEITNMCSEVQHIYDEDFTVNKYIESTNAKTFKNLTSQKMETVNFKAIWEPNQYTVKLILNKGKGSTDPKCSKSEVKVTFDKYYNLPNAEREGYTFDGWYTQPTDGTQVTNKTIVLTPKDHEVYAHWTPNTYTIKYNGNKGGGSTTPELSKNNPTSATFDVTYTIEPPTREGYTFTGWKISGMDNTMHTYGNVESSTNTITLTDATKFKNLRANNGVVLFTAQWKANTYTVSFDLNKGTGSTVPKIDGKTSKEDITVQFDKTFNVKNPTRTGYKFVGWRIIDMDTTLHTYGSNTSKAETLNNVKATTFKNLRATNGKVKFTATWEAIKYKVVFDNSSVNPGIEKMSDLGDLVVGINFDEKFDLPERTYLKTGYCFVGWSIDRKIADPTPQDVDLKDGEKGVINLSDEDGDVVVLYPLWEIAPPSVVPDPLPDNPTEEDINPTVLPDGDDDKHIRIESYPIYMYETEPITNERLKEEIILIPIKNEFDIRINDFDIINISEIKDYINRGIKRGIPVSMEVEFNTSNSKVRDTVIVKTDLTLLKSTQSDVYSGYTRYIDTDNSDKLTEGSKWSLSNTNTLHNLLKDSLTVKDEYENQYLYEIEQ